MNFKLRQLDAFRAIAQAGSVTRAAVVLGVSQPAVSRLLADLSKTVDFELFRRKDGQVELTNANVQVQGGALESSNVNPLSEMTDMIALQRQFEMHLKLMKTAEEVDASSSSLLRAF